jgi:endonuclease/exonuclease/phosphatase family metal-dependent hydrolase
VEEEQYGNAVLSWLPFRLVQAKALPSLPRHRPLEPRSAICVAIEVGGFQLHLVNTHLGLSRRERRLQIDALLANEWLSNSIRSGPCVVCGDFNAMPGSYVYRKMCAKLRDAQVEADDHRPRPTWIGHYPVGRIDHVFVSHEVRVLGVEVPRTQLAKTASDHLPLLVELQLVIARQSQCAIGTDQPSAPQPDDATRL